MADTAAAFLDEHVAIGEGERPAIVTPSEVTSYARLLELVNQTGHVLRDAGADVEQYQYPPAACAELLRDAQRNREIAERLGIAEGTVKLHLHTIYTKLASTGAPRSS